MQTCSCWTGTFLASADEVHQVYLGFVFFLLLFLFKHLLFMVGPHWHSLAAQLPQQSIPPLAPSSTKWLSFNYSPPEIWPL